MAATDLEDRGGRSARQTLSRKSSAGIWPLYLLTLSLFVPAQFYVDIGSFRLSAYRIALFLILPSLIARIASSKFRAKTYDILVLLAAVWMILAMSVNHGFLQGLESGGITAFETVVGYLTARVFLTNRVAIISFAEFLISALVVLVVLLLLEIIADRRLIHDLTSWLSGHPASYDDRYRRLGFIRAQGPFAHAIHAGIFMIALLSFAWLTSTSRAKRLFRTGALTLGALATLSSAPWLGGLLQLGLLVYHRLCRYLRVPKPWTWLFLGIGALVIFLEFASNRGAVGFLATSTTLDPATAYYRILIWRFGSETVWQNPVFGIGYDDWSRPEWMTQDSVDAYWLLVAMTYGLPVVIALGYAVIDIFRRLVRIHVTAEGENKNIALATSISLFALVFVGFTVHYWGSAYILYLTILGLGGSVAAGALTRGPRSATRRNRATLHNL